MGLTRKAAQRTTRAELEEAMNQARPLAGHLRAAIVRQEALGPAPMLKAAGALRETIGSLRSDIRSIAQRAYLDDEEALICILAAEESVRAGCRRKPSFEQIRRALSRRAEDAERNLHAAHEAVTEAQQHLERATRAAIVTRDARVLMGVE